MHHMIWKEGTVTETKDEKQQMQGVSELQWEEKQKSSKAEQNFGGKGYKCLVNLSL